MANDNKTTIEIVADAAGMKSGSAQAAEINKSTTDKIKADWANTSSQVTSSVGAMGTGIKNTMAGISSSFSGVQRVVLGLAAVVAGGSMFKGIIDKTIDWTGQVRTLGKTLGITMEDASVLAVALRHIGMSTEDYGNAAKKIAQTLLKNEKAFGDLNVEVRNTDGTFKSSQEIMKGVTTALGGIKEGTDRNVAMAEIFKRSNVDVAKIMSLNAQAMENARIKAEELHLIVGPEGAAMAKKYKESLNDLKLVNDSLSIAVGSVVLPVVVKFGSVIAGIPSAVIKLTNENQNLIQGVVAGGVAWGVYTLAVGAWTAGTKVAVITQGLATAATYLWGEATALMTLGFGALTTAEMLALGGWILAAIAGIVVYMNGFGQSVNDVCDVFVILGNVAQKAFSIVKAAIFAVMGDMDGARKSFNEGLTLNVKVGVGQDWYSKIKSSLSSTFMPETKAPGASAEGANFNGPSDTTAATGPSAYDIAKAKYQVETDVLGMSVAKKLELYQKDLANYIATTAEQLDYNKGLSNLKYEAAKEAIEKEKAFMELEAADNIKTSESGMQKRLAIAQKETALMISIFGKDSKEYADAKKKEIDIMQKASEQKYLIAKDLSNKIAQMAEDEKDLEIEAVQFKYDLGQISEAEEIAQLNRLEAEKRRIKLKAMQDDLILIGKDKGTDSNQYKQQLTSIELYQSQMRLAATKGSNQLSKILQKPWVDLKKGVQSSLQSSIAGFLKGTTTIKGAISSMASSIGSMMVDMWAKDIAATIMGTGVKTAAIATGAAAQTGITAAAAGASVAATMTTTAANMTMLESIGVALSSIPWYGWVGLAILAGVASARGSGGGGAAADGSGNLGRSPDSYYNVPGGVGLPSYDVGSWGLPADGAIMAHKGEVVVPSKGGFADAFRNGTLGQGGNGGHKSKLVMNVNATALDGMGVGRIIGNAGRQVAQGLQKVQRSLSIPNATQWGRV